MVIVHSYVKLPQGNSLRLAMFVAVKDGVDPCRFVQLVKDQTIAEKTYQRVTGFTECFNELKRFLSNWLRDAFVRGGSSHRSDTMQ